MYPRKRVEGHVIKRSLSEAKARKMPSRPAGARVMIQAFCRGDHKTSPSVKPMFHRIADVTDGESISGRGEAAMIHMPGRMTRNASKLPVTAPTRGGSSIQPHRLMEWMV
jgi:hypothetical protein